MAAVKEQPSAYANGDDQANMYSERPGEQICKISDKHRASITPLKARLIAPLDSQLAQRGV